MGTSGGWQPLPPAFLYQIKQLPLTTFKISVCKKIQSTLDSIRLSTHPGLCLQNATLLTYSKFCFQNVVVSTYSKPYLLTFTYPTLPPITLLFQHLTWVCGSTSIFMCGTSKPQQILPTLSEENSPGKCWHHSRTFPKIPPLTSATKKSFFVSPFGRNAFLMYKLLCRIAISVVLKGLPSPVFRVTIWFGTPRCKGSGGDGQFEKELAICGIDEAGKETG